MADPQASPAVSQSPLVAALSTPSTAMFHPNSGFNGPPIALLRSRPTQPGWPMNQPHNDGPSFNTPPGNGGPIRVQQPINIRPAPYPQGHVVRISHPPGQPGFNNPHPPPGPQQVMQRPMPPAGHPMPPQQIHGPPPPPAPVMHMGQPVLGNIIDKIRLDELVKQIDPNTNLEDNVKDALIEYCEEFVADMISKVCNIASYRTIQSQAASKKIEAKDVELVLHMAYNMPAVPRAAVHVFGQPATQYPKLDGHPPTEAHKQRMLLIRKQVKKI